MAYYLLTGRHVFEGKTVVEVCAHHLHTPPTPPSQHLDEPLPEPLEALVLRCLEKEPGARPQTAREVVDELRRVRRDLDAPWDHDRAAAWWADRGKLTRGPAPTADTSAVTRTLAVDLNRARA